jgi:glycosyltransferase involved in cell wall biosynthesis
MKIVFIDTINNIPSHKQFQDLATSLVTNKKNEVLHLSDTIRDSYCGVIVHCYKKKNRFLQLINVLKSFASFKPDIVISTFRGNVYTDVFSYLFPFKWIATIQSDFYHNRFYNRFRFLKTDKIIVLSETIKPKLASMYPHIRDRIVVVPNSFEFVPLNITPKLNIILHVGGDGLNREGKLIKGTDVLIGAFENSSLNNSDAELWIVGNYKNMHSENKQIKFLGRQSHNEVLELMQVAKVMALPSRNEAFGQVFIEAMQYSCSLIGTENTGAVDIIEQGNYGYIVPQEDVMLLSLTLVKAITNYGSSEECWATYSQKRKQFSRDIWIDTMMNLIESNN